MKKVVVLTPTIGKKELKQACESVATQTYQNIEHIVVVDGEKFANAVNEVLSVTLAVPTVCVLPHNTGGGGFYGHRVIAGFSKLINADYFCVLDEDNWFDVEHVASLVKTFEEDDLDFSFSLRRYCDEDGQYLIDDNCESVGDAVLLGGTFVDTNAYMYKTEFIRTVGHLWDNKWAADRTFFRHLMLEMQPKPKFNCSGYRTLNYRLGKRSQAHMELMLKEIAEVNERNLLRFGGKYPWVKD
jgi:glycosyltransferase involved in cell wall biosynthesis